jgi:hypothetical protein
MPLICTEILIFRYIGYVVLFKKIGQSMHSSELKNVYCKYGTLGHKIINTIKIKKNKI